MVSVNSFRSNLASVNASGFQARMALTAGCSGIPSSTAALPMNVFTPPILKVRLVLAPVQDAFAHNVIEPDGYKPQIDQHLPESEECGTCRSEEHTSEL